MDKSYMIEAKCLFCEETLKKEEDKEFESGDLIKCSSCGEMNDYDAVLEVAKEKGLELIKADATKDLKKIFKKF